MCVALAGYAYSLILSRATFICLKNFASVLLWSKRSGEKIRKEFMKTKQIFNRNIRSNVFSDVSRFRKIQNN